MDKIWDRNPSKSEVSGRCGRDEKTNDHADRKLNAKKTPKKNEKEIDLVTSSTILFTARFLSVLNLV